MLNLALSPLLLLLKSLHLEVVRPNRNAHYDYAELSLDQIRALRTEGLDWPPRAYTMVGLKRLENIQFCAEAVLRDGVPGDFMETGVWRGGAAIFMKGVLKAYGDQTRQVWLADSFRGLPPPDVRRYPADVLDFSGSPELSVSRQSVEANFRAYGLLDDKVHFLEGWFEDTLPAAPIERLAILRLDGDMYESTIQTLNALYDKLSPGGFLIVDDFCIEPCRKAVDDFRGEHRIVDPIVDIDGTGAYWRKVSHIAGTTPSHAAAGA